LTSLPSYDANMSPMKLAGRNMRSVNKVSRKKQGKKKNITDIVCAHHAPHLESRPPGLKRISLNPANDFIEPRIWKNERLSRW